MKIETGLSTAFGFAKNILDKVWPPEADPNKKLEAAAEIEAAVQNRDTSIISAKKEIIVAEMNQGDNFTKRARPAVVYMGLVFIALVHVLFPITIKCITIFRLTALSPAQLGELANLTALSLPSEFWLAWGSVVSIWSVGRSMEKRGTANKVIQAITGVHQ
jgi:hypothetical protein